MVLSADQRQAIQEGREVPIAVDQIECVIVRKDVYDNLSQQKYDDSKLDIREAYPLMDAVARQEGWDDPAEDLYDDLVPDKQ